MDELQRIRLNAGLVKNTAKGQLVADGPIKTSVNAETTKKTLNESTENDTIEEGGEMMDDPMRGYDERDGLEGPFKIGGRILYYDPMEGAYYDPTTDIYLDDEEASMVHGQRQFEQTAEAFENFIREMGMDEDFSRTQQQKPSFGKRKPAADVKQHPSYNKAMNSAMQLMAQNPDPDLAAEITAKEYAGEMGIDAGALKVAIAGDLAGADSDRLAKRFD